MRLIRDRNCSDLNVEFRSMFPMLRISMQGKRSELWWGVSGRGGVSSVIEEDWSGNPANHYESSFRKLSISKRSRAVNLPSTLTWAPARKVRKRSLSDSRTYSERRTETGGPD